MTQKSLEERITSFETKAQKLLAQAKLLRAKKIEQDRKARTRRLIQIGAVVEKVFNTEINNLKELETILIKIKMNSDDLNNLKKSDFEEKSREKDS